MNIIEKYILNFSLSLDPDALSLSLRKAPLGAYNTRYEVHSLHFVHPNCSFLATSHIVNVLQNNYFFLKLFWKK